MVIANKYRTSHVAFLHKNMYCGFALGEGGHRFGLSMHVWGRATAPIWASFYLHLLGKKISFNIG